MEVKAKPHLHQDWIDPHAGGIVKALQKNGFTTYLVGGCVRDLLLNIHPKDFDIATAAVPQQVKRLIYMSFIIGKRFRLVLVKREDQQFEVATFRREVTAEDIADPNSPTGDNIFGTPEEDARRRDFTVNGLFYDPINDQLIDHVGGIPDIEARILRMIGDPGVRLTEDSIRILRGLRLSHKLHLTIEPTLRAAMSTHASDLAKSVLPRRREEILKILRLEAPDLALLECFDLGILKQITPTLDDFIQDPARREMFFTYLNAFQDVVDNQADTVQLFGWLAFAFLRAAQDCAGENSEPITIESEVMSHFMAMELGMYKFEQSNLVDAISIIPHLKKSEDFRRRGERRQLSMMKNEGFKLAFRFALADFEIGPLEAAFWRETYEKLAGQLRNLEAEAKAKRRRRPRRRRPGDRGAEGGAKSGGGGRGDAADLDDDSEGGSESGSEGGSDSDSGAESLSETRS